MNELGRYLLKKKPPRFFFTHGMAILRYSTRTDIHDMRTCELLHSLPVRHLSQIAFCKRYQILYLKSVIGPVYAYHLNTQKLMRICNTGTCDYEIFLSADQESFIPLPKKWISAAFIFLTIFSHLKS